MRPEDWDWSRPIFDHVEVRASDYPQSVRFYETVLATLGIPRMAETDETEELTSFANLSVVNRTPPTHDLHVCFRAASRDEVDRFHSAGVEAGFRSNGEPGYRDHYGPGYYAAFLLDPDGNNVEALYRDVGNIGHTG